MNKLISKDPVQRFKQGRKIFFWKGGSGRWFYNGKEVFSNDGGKTFIIDNKGSYVQPGMNRNLVQADKVGRNVYKSNGKWYRIGSGREVQSHEFKSSVPQKFKTSTNGRFRVKDRSTGESLRFDSKDEAKKYQMQAKQQGTRVLYDDEMESRGSVLRMDRSKEKVTEYGRNKLESNNNLSFKQAYQKGRQSGNKYFAWRGSVYKTDLENGVDNMTEMMQLYGNNLGYTKHPNLNSKQSVSARQEYRKNVDAKQGNRNANYQGKTNSQANAEADKKVTQSWNEEDFVDALLPATVIGNGINYLTSLATGENFTPKVFHSGLNPAVGMANFMRGEWNKVAERGLNAASIFGGPWISKGVKWLGVKMAPSIGNLSSKSAYLAQRATIPTTNSSGRTLNKMAERAVSGNFTSPTTTYGRYSLQKAADQGVLDQFATNGGFNNAIRWGDRLVRNNNTGTGYIFRSGTPHPYDVTVDNGIKILPWVNVATGPTAGTTLRNLSEE